MKPAKERTKARTASGTRTISRRHFLAEQERSQPAEPFSDARRRRSVSRSASFTSGNATIVDWGMIMAAGVMITAPAVIFFATVQRYLVQGWGAGGVKG